MKTLLVSVLASLGSTATLTGFVLTLSDGDVRGWWVALLVAAIGAGVVAAVTEIVSYWRGRPLRFKSDDKIKRFMREWIGKSGHAFVCTRNLGWVDDERSKMLLREKAQTGDLSIVIPKPLPFATELEGLGAHIYTYPEADWQATTRFTIIRHGRADAEVAVGLQIDGRHEIATFKPGQDHAFGLADDLANALRRLA